MGGGVAEGEVGKCWLVVAFLVVGGGAWRRQWLGWKGGGGSVGRHGAGCVWTGSRRSEIAWGGRARVRPRVAGVRGSGVRHSPCNSVMVGGDLVRGRVAVSRSGGSLLQ
jgi:hypothetical protein